MRPSSVIPIEELEGGYDEGAWDVPSRSGDARFPVTLERETDTLVCTCRGFRTHRHCWHTINVARYIAMRRQAVEMETRLREFEQEEVNGQCAG
jgi:hypothetical protein